MNILFRTHDPRLLEVVLHRSRYVNHIWPNHSVVMVEYIQDVIEQPEFITLDADDEYIENYYKQDVIVDYPDLYLKVCVLFKAKEQGRIITAFPVDWPKVEEELLWQK